MKRLSQQEFQAIWANNLSQLDSGWQQFFNSISETSWYQQLFTNVMNAYTSEQLICPPLTDIFQALALSPLAEIKVVIIGQDPYHQKGMANGLAFATHPNQPTPSSLRNIYSKLQQEYQLAQPIKYLDLKAWAYQGVLLINTCLTVQLNYAHSHKDFGWSQLIHHLLVMLQKTHKHLIYVGWGKHAQKIINNLHVHKNQCFYAPHPSGLSAHLGFFDHPIFQAINAQLVHNQRKPIDWLMGVELIKKPTA